MYWKSKNGVETAQNPFFKKLRAIFGKSYLMFFCNQKFDQKMRYWQKKVENHENTKMVSKWLKPIVQEVMTNLLKIGFTI